MLLGDCVVVIASVNIHVAVWAGLHAGVRVAHLARARLTAIVVTEARPQPMQCCYRTLPVGTRCDAGATAAASPAAAAAATAATNGGASAAPAHAVAAAKIGSGGLRSVVAGVGFTLRMRVVLEYALPLVSHLLVPERVLAVVGSPGVLTNNGVEEFLNQVRSFPAHQYMARSVTIQLKDRMFGLIMYQYNLRFKIHLIIRSSIKANSVLLSVTDCITDIEAHMGRCRSGIGYRG